MFNKDKVYIIAELSANHNQDFDIAVKSLEAMKMAGADAVKLQTFTPESLTLNSEQAWFQTRKDSLWAGQKLYDLYKQGATPWEWHPKLQALANDLGLDFFSSPFDFDAVDRLETLNVPLYKIASLEITDIPLITKVAQTGKPMIISTGVAEEKDIDLAVDTARNEGCSQIALLKCTSAYPTPYDEINLRAIPLLEKKYKVISGLSDHTLGISVPVAAVAIGAKIIEKHFILDKEIPSIDKAFSLDPSEFKSMVDAIRQVEQAMGEETLTLSPKAMNAKASARSLFAIKDLKKGDIITSENIKSLRPALGLHPKYYYSILGKKIRKDIEKGTPLNMDLIE
ncbi:MAG: pseudaminic acid synthase [Bacteroidales bacterium]|nr:pseudaminic acid synthase [Bacteroidales bacterium]MCF8405476.1 pseudaminic acid synthase [Bacteroidales bacterium]